MFQSPRSETHEKVVFGVVITNVYKIQYQPKKAIQMFGIINN